MRCLTFPGSELGSFEQSRAVSHDALFSRKESLEVSSQPTTVSCDVLFSREVSLEVSKTAESCLMGCFMFLSGELGSFAASEELTPQRSYIRVPKPCSFSTVSVQLVHWPGSMRPIGTRSGAHGPRPALGWLKTSAQLPGT